MKKFLSILMAIMMVMACTVAFAADTPTITGNEAQVSVSFNPNELVYPKVYSINVDWETTPGSIVVAPNQNPEWKVVDGVGKYVFANGTSKPTVTVTAPSASYTITNLSSPGISYRVNLTRTKGTAAHQHWVDTTLNDFFEGMDESVNTFNTQLFSLGANDLEGNVNTISYNVAYNEKENGVDADMLYNIIGEPAFTMTDEYTFEFTIQ